jgi:Arc/MetJ-type ribon-helix-helix transcriptional regulator
MTKQELKSMYIGARVSTSFYGRIRDYMRQKDFDNISEFLRYCMRKVLESEEQ